MPNVWRVYGEKLKAFKIQWPRFTHTHTVMFPLGTPKFVFLLFFWQTILQVVIVALCKASKWCILVKAVSACIGVWVHLGKGARLTLSLHLPSGLLVVDSFSKAVTIPYMTRGRGGQGIPGHFWLRFASLSFSLHLFQTTKHLHSLINLLPGTMHIKIQLWSQSRKLFHSVSFLFSSHDQLYFWIRRKTFCSFFLLVRPRLCRVSCAHHCVVLV